MNRPWMPWYIADYLADTAHLRAAQSGAYLHLIMHYWQRGGLPSDNVQLAAIARMSDAEWKKARPILEPFFQMPGWKHKRVDEELAKSQAKYEARAAAGKRGGEAKAGAKQNPSNATAKRAVGLNQPQPQPLTDDEMPRARGGSMISQAAYDVTSELERAFGFALPEDLPPGWHGCAMWVQKCLDQGWKAHVMIGAGKIISKRARTTINSYTYLEKPMAEIIAENERPLPKVEIKEQETVHVPANRASSSDRSAQGAIARLRERIASKRGDDHEPDPDAVRLLSQG